MIQELGHFRRIIKHYIVLALRLAGAGMDYDLHAELDTAFKDLEPAIRRIVRDELDERERMTKEATE